MDGVGTGPVRPFGISRQMGPIAAVVNDIFLRLARPPPSGHFRRNQIDKMGGAPP
jgi:hypothetical protein